MFKEDLAAGEDGITLNYEAGNGWKYTYNTTIGMRFGQPCLLQLSVFEHSSGAEYQSVRDFNFENGEKCFPRQPLPARFSHAAQGRRHRQVLR